MRRLFFVYASTWSIVAAAALLGASPSVAAAVRGAAPNHRVSHGTSTNWSGYAVSGHGPYTSVSSSWRQPAAQCAKTPTGWSSFWVGLDGDTTNTVEQTGTEADCSHGTPVYYAWYEMYPKASVQYSNPVSAGDSLSASVTSLGSGYFRLTLKDSTKAWSRTTTLRLKSAKLGSAEVIAEAPSGGGVLPLADFGTVDFSGADANGLPFTASTPGLEPITMVTSGGTREAAPSGISAGAFLDTWYSL
jgi:hypothetical protein